LMEGAVNWQFFCNEHEGLERFKFFMLAADTLPDMQYGETRKREIVSWECRTVTTDGA